MQDLPEFDLLYRRSEAEMPARAEEVHHAREEGIDFQVLTAPVEFLSDGKGWLTTLRTDARSAHHLCHHR